MILCIQFYSHNFAIVKFIIYYEQINFHENISNEIVVTILRFREFHEYEIVKIYTKIIIIYVITITSSFSYFYTLYLIDDFRYEIMFRMVLNIIIKNRLNYNFQRFDKFAYPNYALR